MSEENEILKRTPLYEQHLELGAKMVPFSGWEMPVQYDKGIIAEHNHTREKVSLFDICHMGEFRLAGKGALNALDKILARSVANLPIGSCAYNYLLNDQGGVMDDLIVYRMDEDDCFIVVNAGNIQKDFTRINSLIEGCLTFENLSDNIAKLDLQGPESANVLLDILPEGVTLPKYFKWIKTEIFDVPCILSRTGYTGELGFEIYIGADNAELVWDGLLDYEVVEAVGLGARDTLRLEMGYALYGHELNDELSPLDCGGDFFVKLDETRDFAGKNALKERPIKKKLVAVALDSRRAARAESSVMDANGEVVGVVTSGAFCPTMQKSCAMCSVDIDFECAVGDEIMLGTAKTKLTGKVVKLPFYLEGTCRNKID